LKVASDWGAGDFSCGGQGVAEDGSEEEDRGSAEAGDGGNLSELRVHDQSHGRWAFIFYPSFEGNVPTAKFGFN